MRKSTPLPELFTAQLSPVSAKERQEGCSTGSTMANQSSILDSYIVPTITRPVYTGENVYIRPDHLVVIPQWFRDGCSRSFAQFQNEKNLLDNSHKGKLSIKATKGLRSSINWLLCSAEKKPVYCKLKDYWFDFKVNFVTLTLPDTSVPIGIKDFQNKLMNPWLTNMRKNYGLNNYVWKIEFQKNGKIHVHITTDTFLHWRKIRSTWNSLLKLNGWMDDFKRKFGHDDPNSTDVHSVRNIKNLGAYICKYMVKDSGAKEGFRGRIWGCSQALSQVGKLCVNIPADQVLNELSHIEGNGMELTDIVKPPKPGFAPYVVGRLIKLTYKNWQKDIEGVVREKFMDSIMFLRRVIVPEEYLQFVV